MPRTLPLTAALLAGFAATSLGATPPEASKAPPPRVAATPVLTTFTGEREFRRYLEHVRRAAKRRNLWWAAKEEALRFAQAGPAGDAQSDAAAPLVCGPDDLDCPKERDSDGRIVVTGALTTPTNASITNTQKIGVDEGDIVKQVGNFLLVLQDGRLFSVDLGSGAAGLRVADRVNVYRDPLSDTWYDEMLVAGDRILVTGYSFMEEATELSLFRVGETGRLESLGTFYMSSNDYYDTDNYATRLVGDRLIVYTPLALADMRPDRPLEWPVVRRWLPGEERDEARRRGRPLLDVRNVYKPVVETYVPVIHTVSVCPLGEADGRRDLQCRSTGFIGPAEAEFYVSTTAAYLWTSPAWDDSEAMRADRRCRSHHPAGFDYPGALYALPLGAGPPGVVGVHGGPLDHYSLETHDGEFRALLATPTDPCGTGADESFDETVPTPLSYFRIPLSRFAPELEEAGRRAYTRVPSPESPYIANRFTDDYVVYGSVGRRSLWFLFGERVEGEEVKPRAVPATAFAVPVRRPDRVRRLPLLHSVIRAERSGDDIVLTGYRDPTGLDISYVDLGGEPRIASNLRLPGRYESEGRSHAFNSAVDGEGAGLMGLPTVARPDRAGRWWWDSLPSDVSFLGVDSAGRLASAGELLSGTPPRDEDHEDEDGVAGYECEVSCVDWYGNSRPIFTGGRILALTGTELIEGRLEAGRIRETARLNLAGPSRVR